MAAKFPGDIFGECCVCERSIEYRAKAFSGCGHNICEHCWYKYKFPTHYSSILCPICADRRKRSESFVNSAQESNSDANHDEGCIADMLGPDVLLQFNVQQASDLFSVQEDPQELSQQISSQHRHGLGIEMLLIPQNQEISGSVCMVCNSAANHVSEFSDKLLCKQCAQIYKKAVAEPQYTHPHVFYFEEHPVQQKSTSSPTPITFTFFKQEQPCSVPPFPAALPPDDSYNVKPASHVQQTMQQNFQQHQLPRQFQSSQVRQSQPQETQCYHLLSVQPPPVPRNHILHNHQSPFSSDPFQSHESSASKVRSHHSSAPVSTARAITNHPSDLMTNQIFSTSLRSCSTNSTLLSNQLLKPSSGPAVEKDSRALSQRNSPALDCTDLRNELPSQFTKQLFQENQFESQQSMWEQSGRSVLAPYGDSCNMERFSPFGFQNQPNHWPHPTSPISSLVEKASSLPVGSVHSQKSPILTSNDKLSFQVNGPNSHLRVCSCSEVSNKCTEESECRVGIQNSSSEDLTQWDQIAELWDKLHLIERDRESYKDYLFEQPILIDNREDTVCAEIKDHFRMIQESCLKRSKISWLRVTRLLKANVQH
ncbi:uncharacterized protein LOC112576852 isoform X2 [Pomacea canaliculata]|uniref:uncharacterized protein LOC112576852 isoform X2 n=1 Tax=Pomacea canaliculata TaxID=400727 RepID=UPI000D7377E5|nr:uncharacterized protein LOC112576852 isoform X2 [Pomacea canaliculata]